MATEASECMLRAATTLEQMTTATEATECDMLLRRHEYHLIMLPKNNKPHLNNVTVLLLCSTVPFRWG
jgi:hypothetical protein